MAALASTFVTTGSKTNRETLSDVVDRLEPWHTPIYSMIDHPSITGTHSEWPVDEMSPPGANVNPEGDEYDFDAILPAQRVGNYTQILDKEFAISNTQEAVREAGNVNKMKETKLKKGKELRSDVEYSIVSNVGSVGGATRISGGLPSWIETNVSRGAGGANGGFNSATGLTEAAANGAQRAFTKALLDTTMGQCFTAGADVTDLIVSPYVKSVFVTFMSDANVAPFRYAAKSEGKNTIISNADVYEGPYGMVTIKPNRVMAVNADVARNAFLLDREKLSWPWLRAIQEDKDLAKTGDKKSAVLLGEGCLQVSNEKGLGIVADLFGLSAST